MGAGTKSSLQEPSSKQPGVPSVRDIPKAHQHGHKPSIGEHQLTILIAAAGMHGHWTQQQL